MPVSFDGIDDFMSVASFTAQPGADSWSLSFWANPNLNQQGAVIIQRTTGTAFSQWGVYLSNGTVNNGTGNVLWAIFRQTVANDYRRRFGTSNDGNWHHYMAVYNDSGSNIQLYRNGVLDNGAAGGTWPTAVNTSSAPFSFGRPGNANSSYFGGFISEVSVWNTALTATHAVMLSSYVKGIPLQVSTSSLLGYWPLDDYPDGTSADANNFFDRSINGYVVTGDNGSNNTGLTMFAEQALSYQPNAIYVKGNSISQPGGGFGANDGFGTKKFGRYRFGTPKFYK